MRQHDLHGPRAGQVARPEICPDLFERRADPWWLEVERLREAGPWPTRVKPKVSKICSAEQIFRTPDQTPQRLRIEGADRAFAEARAVADRTTAHAARIGPRPAPRVVEQAPYVDRLAPDQLAAEADRIARDHAAWIARQREEVAARRSTMKGIQS